MKERNCPACLGSGQTPCRLCYATGTLSSLDWAFTKDGQACNGCGGRVAYIPPPTARWAHSEPAPDCPEARKIARWDGERKVAAELRASPQRPGERA